MIAIFEVSDKYSFHTLIAGDLNSRTATGNCSLADADLDFSDTDFFQRNSCDSKMNAFGKDLLKLCDVFDVVILNGL